MKHDEFCIPELDPGLAYMRAGWEVVPMRGKVKDRPYHDPHAGAAAVRHAAAMSRGGAMQQTA